MTRSTLGRVVLTATLAVCAAGAPFASPLELERQRLVGAAQYENGDLEAAAAAFASCVEMAPESAADHFNLALTLLRQRQHERAMQVLDTVAGLDPGLLGTPYLRGIVLKREGQYDAAARSLRLVTEQDPTCVGAHYNLGICLKNLGELASARAELEAAVALNPDHASSHYQLSILARRTGDQGAARFHAAIFGRLRSTIDEAERTQEALEHSRYSELLIPGRHGAGPAPAPHAKVRFVDVTEASGIRAPERQHPVEATPIRIAGDGYDPGQARSRYVPAVGGAVELADVDRDGDLDIYVVGCAATPASSANRLHVNLGDNRFAERAQAFGVDDARRGTDAVFGDLDNDGHDDLYVVNDGANVLYRKLGDGVYEATGVDPRSGLALTVLALPDPLPELFSVAVDLVAMTGAGGERSGFVILGYEGPQSFVFAGVRVTRGYWTIGHYDGTWVEDARLDATFNPKATQTFRVEVDGASVVLRPQGTDTGRSLAHELARPLAHGGVGLAAVDSGSRFDNLRIAPLGGGEPLWVERFADGRADAFAASAGTWRVADWAFADVSRSARADEPQLGRAAVMVDYDHDGDLDLFVVNGADLDEAPEQPELLIPDDLPGQVNTMLRSSGDGTFSDRTDEAGLLVDIARSRDVVLADLDGDTDIDLFVANEDSPSTLFLNQRQGRFAVAGELEPAADGDARAVAAADLDRDGDIDLVVAIAETVRVYVNDGRARFAGTLQELAGTLASTGASKLETLDYNNDGWQDLLLVAADGSGLHLMAGSGPARFEDVTERVALDRLAGVVMDVAIGDLDGDGDEDLVALTRDRGVRLLLNHGGNARHWIDIRCIGGKSNRNAYGASAEVAAPGHYQRKTVVAGRLHFGLGELDRVEVVRITWPNGVVQNLLEPAVDAVVTIKEQRRVAASCAFLWSHNGDGFELVNEVLGIGALGAPVSPGVYHQPDSTELLKIEAGQLVARDGLFELRLTEELREIVYADRISLRVVDHPAEIEIVPNEGFKAPPFPEDMLYAVAGHRAPRSAVDDQGRDVLELVRRRDGRSPTFALVPRYDGLAEPHSLILDIGDHAGAGQIVLFLDGWIYWPDASTVMAVSQDQRYSFAPPSIDVRSETGQWERVIDSVALPTSKGLVVPVDLTGLLPSGRIHVRVSTTMCLYLDRVFVSERPREQPVRVIELPVHRAELRYRGFSELDRDRLGYERFDYRIVSYSGPWSPPRGMLTRYGDVTPLLSSADDIPVIFGAGDELGLSFAATTLPDLAEGWTRDFVFAANGWVKDGDLNTAHSRTVGPLPFRAMSAYPYPETEAYPDTPRHRRYLDEYNTRPAVPTVGVLP